MNIRIWSDFQCPFCYMGEKMLESALTDVGLTEPVEIEYKSYQLDPEAPAIPKESMTEHFMSGHSMSIAEAEVRMEKITHRAATVGLHYNLPGVQVCNTRDAHRLMKYAAERLSPWRLKKLNFLLFKANFEENRLLSDHSVLASLAEECGLDSGVVMEMLAGDAYADAVLRDQEEIDGRSDFEFVPYMLFSDGSVMQGVMSEGRLMTHLKSVMSGEPTDVDPSDTLREGCGSSGCSI